MAQMAPIALTAGEPAGIGPDLCLVAASRPRSWPLVCLGDRDLLAARARRLRLPGAISDSCFGREVQYLAGTLTVLHQPLAAECVAGRLEMKNARSVLTL